MTHSRHACSVGAGLYNLRRANALSPGLGGRRRTETPAGHGSSVNEDRFAALMDCCDEHGLRVRWADLGPTRYGQYRSSLRLIELNQHCNLRQLVPALAHEFAHFIYDDECSTPANERRAWEHAARMLISAEEYARAECIVGSHPNAIASELDLTPVLVDAWRRQHRAAREADGWSA